MFGVEAVLFNDTQRVGACRSGGIETARPRTVATVSKDNFYLLNFKKANKNYLCG